MRKAAFVFLFASISCAGVSQASEARPERTVSIAAAGDIMVHDPLLASAYESNCRCWNFDSVFEPVRDLISQADFSIANLETTLPGNPYQFRGYPQFGSPDALASALRAIGFDMLVRANNHALDTGGPGALRTGDFLDSLGIRHTGVFSSRIYPADRVASIDPAGFRLVILNYTYDTNGIPVPQGVVVNSIEEARIREDLMMARKLSVDAVIVFYHFGTEYMREPDAYQLRWTQFALENGADIVLGSHPHVVQRFEKRVVTDIYGETKERLIVYSFGNFISNQYLRFTDGGIVFRFRLRRTGGSDLKITIDGYDPVWVYPFYLNGKIAHRLLPAEKYLESGGPIHLAPADTARMRLFRDDTRSLLSEGMRLFAGP